MLAPGDLHWGEEGPSRNAAPRPPLLSTYDFQKGDVFHSDLNPETSSLEVRFVGWMSYGLNAVFLMVHKYGFGSG